MKTQYAIVAALTLVAASAARAAVLAGPITNAANGHTYYLLTANTWTASEDEARSLGGHLVTINGAAENQWVADTFFPLTGVSYASLWIGLNDVATEGQFVWSSGEPVTFTYWYPGEPNNAEGIEDYATIRHPSEAPPTVSWNDLWDTFGVVNPAYPVFGVVEISAPLPPSPVVLAGPITNAANGHAYYLLTANTWTASEAKARALGGHLVTINDAAENQWVLETFFPLTGVPYASLWIGLNDAAAEGMFVWASGEPVTFTYWYPGEPNNLGGEDYATIRHPSEAPPTGSWNDLSDTSGLENPGFPVLGVVEVTSSQPPPRQKIRVQLYTTEVTLCWASEVGRRYQAQYSTSAPGRLWLDLGAPVQGNGTTNCVADRVPVGEGHRMYRVVELTQ